LEIILGDPPIKLGSAAVRLGSAAVRLGSAAVKLGSAAVRLGSAAVKLTGGDDRRPHLPHLTGCWPDRPAGIRITPRDLSPAADPSHDSYDLRHDPDHEEQKRDQPLEPIVCGQRQDRARDDGKRGHRGGFRSGD